MVVNVTAFAQVHIAHTTAKARLNGTSRWPSASLLLAQFACPLANIKSHKRVSSNSVLLDCVLRCQPNHGWWCHGIASSDGRISHLVYQQNLEGLQGEPAFVARQWSVAQLPQCAGVDDADVEEGPEEVFPPSLARPAYSVVGPHLVKVVDSSHRLVVAHNTCRHMQGDILVVATRLSHGLSTSICC
ncbi:hypothetical protein NP493_1529g00025 [Ridgeia piscesae]|uniref:Uncharacterized protein n=1 Tax=Ridgeia piscesae TaxID=27915 RepID=A0AAD9K1M6_RIDPI|nr:hypothetical protein NP493_1529g00025 [Ridgeia piscesae]